LLPFNSPVVLVLNSDQSAEDAAVELARIGFTDVRGVMRGTGQWAESGRPLASHETVSAADLIGRLGSGELQVVDVRDPQEWAQGHIPDSIHRYVPDLVSRVGELDPGKPAWVICGTGARASIAAGLLARQGIEPVVVAEGGVPDVIASQATR
jgi:rhodanese-related sulfurtransferase